MTGTTITRAELMALSHAGLAHRWESMRHSALVERSLHTNVPAAEFADASQADDDAWGKFMGLYRELWDKASTGEELEEDQVTDDRPKIESLEALEALPVTAVVMETLSEVAYQKDSETRWVGAGRGWEPQQIDLPATLIYDPTRR